MIRAVQISFIAVGVLLVVASLFVFALSEQPSETPYKDLASEFFAVLPSAARGDIPLSVAQNMVSEAVHETGDLALKGAWINVLDGEADLSYFEYMLWERVLEEME